jgi:2-amino-4-hydroxy-6-hydroxymethyldihydropteridine diphosphokinase
LSATAEAAGAWVPAYVALGSNLDDPPGQLARACNALARLPATRLVAVSSFYGNPPMGEVLQPDFVNAVAGLLTQLAPRALLEALQSIERSHGRDRAKSVRWGPRVLDLDLLVHGHARLCEDGLVLPHPGIGERNFVLFPLLEVAPGLDVPGLGPVEALARRVGPGGLAKLG